MSASAKIFYRFPCSYRAIYTNSVNSAFQSPLQSTPSNCAEQKACLSGLESKKPRLTGRTMQGVLKLPAWIGAAAKCGACINLCTLLLLAKTGDCTFVLGTLGAGILSTCPHVPHGLKAWPRQLATLSTQTCCNLNLP